MFNNKRGDMPTLEEVVKLIPHLALAILLIFILATFYRSCVTEEKDQRDFDFERIIAEINDLGSEESIAVPIKGEFYYITVFEKETSLSDLNCGGKTCLCLYKTVEEEVTYGGRDPDQCERFRNGGKIEEGKCIDGDICFNMINERIENQAKVNVVNLDKNNNIVIISPKYKDQK